MTEQSTLPLYYQNKSLSDMEKALRQNYLTETGWLDSAKSKIAQRAGKPVPWFTYPAIDFLEKELPADLRIFEYGGGQSTLYWSERATSVVSVDHDQAFGSFLSPKLPKNASLSIIEECAEITQELSHRAACLPNIIDPERNDRTYRSGQLNQIFKRYGLELFNWTQDSFDVVIVDGMARVLSAWAATQHFTRDGFIVFDNSDREFYQQAFDIMQHAGYRRIDFSGMGPINPYAWSTSVFYQPSQFTDTVWFRDQNKECSLEESRCERRRNCMGILVLAYNRPHHLQAVLESLRLQDKLAEVSVWIDGTQGRGEYKDHNIKSFEIAQRFNVREVKLQNGHLGIEKLMLDALHEMTKMYDRVLVLEDDCFPLEGSVDEIEKELEAVADRMDVYSVYGHHFGTEPEDTQDFTRFQGWGWAAHSHQIRKLLPELEKLFSMTEKAYLEFIQSELTPEIKERLDRTKGRDVLNVLSQFFSWDSATCFLTAKHKMLHRRTVTKTLQNNGINSGIGHFHIDSERLRKPPFNMAPLEESWRHYDQSTTALPLRGQTLGLDKLDKLIEEHIHDSDGFFIELGAFDGVSQSNSALFEAKGWKGLLIEANPGSFAKCARARPGVIVEHAACVSKHYPNEYVTITDLGLMSMTNTSSFDQSRRSDWLARGQQFTNREPQDIEVRAVTLSMLLDKHAVKQIDLLLLDVEGAEIDVLDGLAFERHAPRYIVAEDVYDNSIADYLAKKGYSHKIVLLERKFTRDCLYIRN